MKFCKIIESFTLLKSFVLNIVRESIFSEFIMRNFGNYYEINSIIQSLKNLFIPAHLWVALFKSVRNISAKIVLNQNQQMALVFNGFYFKILDENFMNLCTSWHVGSSVVTPQKMFNKVRML